MRPFTSYVKMKDFFFNVVPKIKVFYAFCNPLKYVLQAFRGNISLRLKLYISHGSRLAPE